MDDTLTHTYVNFIPSFLYSKILKFFTRFFFFTIVIFQNSTHATQHACWDLLTNDSDTKHAVANAALHVYDVTVADMYYHRWQNDLSPSSNGADSSSDIQYRINKYKAINSSLNNGVSVSKWSVSSIFSTAMDAWGADHDPNSLWPEDHAIPGHCGLIATDNQFVIISFQGTSSYASLITDLNIPSVDLKDFISGSRHTRLTRDFFASTLGPAHAHCGIARASLSTLPHIVDWLTNYYIDQVKKNSSYDMKLILTGHSLGGALATVTAAPLKQLLKELDKNHRHPSAAIDSSLFLISFGSPSVYDKLATTHFETEIKHDHILRVITRQFVDLPVVARNQSEALIEPESQTYDRGTTSVRDFGPDVFQSIYGTHPGNCCYLDTDVGNVTSVESIMGMGWFIKSPCLKDIKLSLHSMKLYHQAFFTPRNMTRKINNPAFYLWDAIIG